MLLDDTGGDGGMRKEGRHVKMVVSLDEDSKWGEVRLVSSYYILFFFFILQSYGNTMLAKAIFSNYSRFYNL